MLTGNLGAKDEEERQCVELMEVDKVGILKILAISSRAAENRTD